MARSGQNDPVEKFRFQLEVISIDLSVTGAITTLANYIPGVSVANVFDKALFTMARLGFSEITSPAVDVGEISYRENIDAARFIKMPGLAKYRPVTLKRGVIGSSSGFASNNGSQDLYNWYLLINNDSFLTASANQLSQGSTIAPAQNQTFRRDVIITSLDREGNAVKRWYLYNAWPSAYRPGNDFNASSDEKLIEELTLTYEFFIEQQGNILAAIGQEVATAAAAFALNQASAAVPSIKNIF